MILLHFISSRKLKKKKLGGGGQRKVWDKSNEKNNNKTKNKERKKRKVKKRERKREDVSLYLPRVGEIDDRQVSWHGGGQTLGKHDEVVVQEA